MFSIMVYIKLRTREMLGSPVYLAEEITQFCDLFHWFSSPVRKGVLGSFHDLFILF